MRKGPTHKVAFVIGIFLFVASPFLFFFAPRWLTPLFCTPDVHEWFACSDIDFYIGVIALIVALVVGTGLMLWVININSRKKQE